jgi:hypothetical protein
MDIKKDIPKGFETCENCQQLTGMSFTQENKYPGFCQKCQDNKKLNEDLYNKGGKRRRKRSKKRKTNKRRKKTKRKRNKKRKTMTRRRRK